MRNIVVLQDRIHEIVAEQFSSDVRITSVACDKSASELYYLTNVGLLLCFHVTDFTVAFRCLWTLNTDDENDIGWFDVNYIAGTGSIICISHSGNISCVQDDLVTGHHTSTIEQIGAIEGGISSAKWNPDQNSLVIATNTNSLLLMSNTWDVLEEVPVSPCLTSSPTSISWRGDGEFFSVLSTDSEDATARVRLYNRNLEVTATGRNVNDGDASVMRGLGFATAYATNGSYVAVSQQRVKGKHQVALVERNGLRHGDFDIRLPALPVGYEDWEVSRLEWDLPSTILAVSLRATRNITTSGADTAPAPSVVQLYHRNNFYWYLKQQWTGDGLEFLGFDAEVVNRLYLAQVTSTNGVRHPAVRIVDITWDTFNNTATADSSTAVVDGTRLLLTPLGKNTVPPPMSLFVEQTAVNTRYASFWTPPPVLPDQQQGFTWGLACLGDDNRSVSLLFGDGKGRVVSRTELNVASLLAQSSVASKHLESLVFRAVAVTQSTDSDGDVLNVVLLGSRLRSHAVSVHTQNLTRDVVPSSEFSQEDQEAADCLDELLVLKIAPAEQAAVDFTSTRLVNFLVIDGLVGSVSRIMTVPHDPSSVAVGAINHVTASFDVLRVSVQIADDICADEDRVVDVHQRDTEVLATLPENCTHVAVITDTTTTANHGTNDVTNGDDHDELSEVHIHDRESAHTVIALSVRNRLYCNETLLVSGASSFVFNTNFNLLMYITLGTRPHLHFSSHAQLVALSSQMGMSDELVVIDCAEPRPVERGAKLVCSVAGDSKVIIQLPRGNLELFEPRPLILMRAQTLLDNRQVLECLVLLRRQRVDLNYLMDYRPSVFLDNVHDFVCSAFATNPDLLSLLVSSVEPVDVTVWKYPRHVGSAASRVPIAPVAASFQGDNKVNTVCRVIREVLLPLLEGRDGGKPQLSAINPILCTFARQRPPLLVEALATIRDTATRAASKTAASSSGSSGSSNTVSLSTAAVQASIKYLAFLAEGSLLFEAALGSCDFEMSRAVARQCQMDPKVYLPLLERFEAISRGHDKGSVQHALMHCRVNLHLNRYQKVVDWTAALFESLLSSTLFSVGAAGTAPAVDTATVSGESVGPEVDVVAVLSDIVVVTQELVKIVDKQDLFAYALPKLYAVQLAHSDKNTAKSSVEASSAGPEVILRSTLSDVRVLYAAKCVSKMNYSEAISAYLSATPPRAIEAIAAARQQGNWQYALIIAGRYCSEERYRSQQMEIAPKRVAQSIVSEFVENLEQGETFGSIANSGDAQNIRDGTGGSEDKVLEAARLSIEYCEDSEGAISILSTAQRWTSAMQVAIKYNRKDLQEEIASAARLAAKDLVKQLPKKGATIASLVAELSVTWADPADRMEKVSTTDALLLEELQGGNNTDGHISDTASEYSAVTQQSMMSFRSDARSIRSGTSTVSVLSNISLSAQSAAASQSPSTSFSIEGLDHSLLSRGKATKNPNTTRVCKRDQTERGQKRLEKSKTRHGRDVWGLRRETALCDELLAYAYVGNVANAVRDTCDLLLILGTAEDHSLATQLQGALNDYVLLITTTPPPVAPMYPAEWLNKRGMKNVLHFQDFEAMQQKLHSDRVLQGNAPILTAPQKPPVESWWAIAANGIKEWQTKRSVVFQKVDVVL